MMAFFMEQKMELKIKEMRPKAQMPSRGTDGAAGFDLYCAEQMNLYPGLVAKVPTGIALEIPTGCAGLICTRSSTALKNLTVFLTVVDSDYRGEVFITVRNDGEETWALNKGDRIAQMLIIPLADVFPVRAIELSETERGSGGYGSTGR